MNKSVVITGVSTGIGYDLAKNFISKGYMVFGSVRNEKDAGGLVDEFGDLFRPLIFDVTDYEAIDRAAGFVAGEVSDGITCLVNNAGIAVGGPLLHVKMEDFEYQFKVNVFGLMKVTQAFAPLLGARKNHPISPGRIIQISSVSGKIGFPFMGPYAGSKHAIEGLSESLRRELLLYGIDVIVVGPGAVKTPIWQKSKKETPGFENTPYSSAMLVFREKFIKSAVKNAIECDWLAKKIVSIAESERPRTRYTFASRKFANYFLPRILPPRIVDRALKKELGMDLN